MQAAYAGERRKPLIVIIEQSGIAAEVERMRAAAVGEPDLPAFCFAICGPGYVPTFGPSVVFPLF